MGVANGLNPSTKAEGDEMRWLNSHREAGSKARTVLPSFSFYSLQILNRLDDAHSQGGRQSTLFSLIQMLISSRSTLTDTLRNNVYSVHTMASQADI